MRPGPAAQARSSVTTHAPWMSTGDDVPPGRGKAIMQIPSSVPHRPRRYYCQGEANGLAQASLALSY
ncbi:hypothetical protein OJF2_58600 [Aquisphaera giovannonii]|uniref:Uncharacterized protein n=1 Tax=Aquisphaera giovannonii TaxID=406548 RepID=A0A5B9W9P0_9BACT|nr:hypothetical protein OJF2_58600 [Aquisphaera giovannonii]